MVATEDLLIVPGGRSVPAVFDRHTGELIYFEINAGGKGTGGSFVTADEKYFYVHTREKGTRAFELETGLKTAFMPNEPVLHQGAIYAAEADGKRRVVRAYDAEQHVIWEIDADGLGDLVLAKDTLVAAGEEAITLIRLPTENSSAEVVRTVKTESPVQRLLVADELLFGVTVDGRIMAFGNGEKLATSPSVLAGNVASNLSVDAAAEEKQLSEVSRKQARELLATGDAEGYAFWFGNASTPLLQSIAHDSPFVQLAVVDSDLHRRGRAASPTGRRGKVWEHHRAPRIRLGFPAARSTWRT